MNMIKDIVYIWNNNLMGDNDEQGVLLSGKYIVDYSKENNNICIKPNENYVAEFWGANIHDCFAVVGDNGTGKTMLMNRIIEDIQNMKSPNLPKNEFIMVAEGQQYGYLCVYCTKQFAEVDIVCDYDRLNCGKKIINSRSLPDLDGFEIAYFHNALNYKDYFSESRCSYDFSLGNTISQHHKITFEMDYYNSSIDKIKNYFDNEAFRMISFLYNYALHNDLKIEFPVPKQIYIKVNNDNYDDDYILNRVKRIRVGRNEENLVSQGAYNFVEAVNNFVDVFGKTWINCTIKNLIFNCFIEICIPVSIPNNISKEYMVFYRACEFLNNKRNIKKEGIYDCAYKVIHNIKQELKDSINSRTLNNLKSFIQWIEKNKSIINRYEIQQIQLCIVPEKETEKFMKGMISLYSDMNFQFPFYDFTFGISTGEYYFLSIFSNLYSMIKSDAEEYYPKLDRKTNSILLIFDEADLSLHPRWQRMYMKWITDFCMQIFCELNVKIIVTTHSPILLSDFPANDVLYFKKNTKGKVFSYTGGTNTFGNNIHTLFLNSFFLEEYGTMGAFAEDKINQIAYKLLDKNAEIKNIEELGKVISYIGEGIIREKLEYAFNKYGKEEFLNIDRFDKNVIYETLSGLKAQKKYLNQLIEKLEENI